MYKLIKNDKTGVVHHVGKSHRGPYIYSMCNIFFGYPFKIYTSNFQEDITCGRCRSILGLSKTSNSKNVTMTQLFEPEDLFLVKIRFSPKVSSITAFFKTKEEKAAYIRGVKTALNLHPYQISIDGKLI